MSLLCESHTLTCCFFLYSTYISYITIIIINSRNPIYLVINSGYVTCHVLYQLGISHARINIYATSLYNIQYSLHTLTFSFSTWYTDTPIHAYQFR